MNFQKGLQVKWITFSTWRHQADSSFEKYWSESYLSPGQIRLTDVLTKSKGNKRETRTYANPYFTFRYFEVCEWSTMHIMFVNHSCLKKVGWYFPTLLKLKSRRITCLSKYNLKVEMREWLTAPLHKQLLAAGVTAAKRGGDPACGDPTRGGRPGAPWLQADEKLLESGSLFHYAAFVSK